MVVNVRVLSDKLIEIVVKGLNIDGSDANGMLNLLISKKYDSPQDMETMLEIEILSLET